jgi:hypothetical protein
VSPPKVFSPSQRYIHSILSFYSYVSPGNSAARVGNVCSTTKSRNGIRVEASTRWLGALRVAGKGERVGRSDNDGDDSSFVAVLIQFYLIRRL